MTGLKKTVTRKCDKPIGKYNLIVQLEPGDMISMRESHSRKWYTVSLHGLFYDLVKSGVATDRSDKAKLKELKKEIYG